MDLSIASVVSALPSSMDPFDDGMFLIFRKILTLSGFWPTQTFRERFVRQYGISFVYLITVLNQGCQFLIIEHDLRSILFALQVFVPLLSFTAVWCAAVVYSAEVLSILNHILEDWKRINSDKELEIMKKYLYETKVMSIFMTLIFCIFFATFRLLPIVLKILSKYVTTISLDSFQQVTCYDYIIDREKYFYPFSIYQTVIGIIIFLGAIMCYTTYLWIIQHIRSCLFIIENEIYRPFQDTFPNDNVVLAEPMDLTNWIIGIIRGLTRTREFVNLVNKLGEQAYLFQISTACVLLTTDLICMSAVGKSSGWVREAALFAFTTIGCMFLIYVNCFIGQKLIDHSAEVYKAMCLVPIHRISVKTQKLLLTTLMMTAKPFAISIGKMFVSSHEFFSDLLRTSLSYGMVLYSLQTT